MSTQEQRDERKRQSEGVIGKMLREAYDRGFVAGIEAAVRELARDGNDA